MQISGRASAGPIKNATVTIYSLNTVGSRARTLATGTTDNSGNFSLHFEPAIATLSQVVIEIGVTDGSYTEESGSATVTFNLNGLRSRMIFDGTSLVAAVTPLTEMAAARADALVAGGMDLAAATAQANAEMAAAAGLTNIITTLPDDPTVANSSPTSQAALYSVLLAGISQYAATLGINSLTITDALKSDFTDGTFNGAASGIAVVVADAGSTTLPANVWTSGVTAAINTYVASADNTAGLGGVGGTPTLVVGAVSPIASGWSAMSTVNEPAPRRDAGAVWTGSEMIVWGGSTGSLTLTGGRYNPATDTWTATSTTSAPGARSQHTQIWAPEIGQMLVWGGVGVVALPLGDGGKYNPRTDSWVAMSSTGAPLARAGQVAVWTRSELIIWGGSPDSGSTFLNTGARYNPTTDTWSAMSTVGAPSARSGAAAVWTGTKMIVAYGTGTATGAAYDPATDTWSAITVAGGFPTTGTSFQSLWTGTEMLTCDNNENCVRYNPATTTWTVLTVPGAALFLYPLVWTGTRAVMWGGQFVFSGFQTQLGLLYDPSTNTFPGMTTVGAPTARNSYVAVWTGVQMLVWGGFDGVSTLYGAGGKFKP